MMDFNVLALLMSISVILSWDRKSYLTYIQGAHWSWKSQGNLIFLQGQGKFREFCKMVREIRKSLKVREKSGNFNIVFVQTAQKLNKQI